MVGQGSKFDDFANRDRTCADIKGVTAPVPILQKNGTGCPDFRPFLSHTTISHFALQDEGIFPLTPSIRGLFPTIPFLVYSRQLRPSSYGQVLEVVPQPALAQG